MNQGEAIGVDVGGSSVKAVRLNAAGELFSETRCSFDPDGPMHFAEAARQVVCTLCAEATARPAALGLCTPGLVSEDGEAVGHLPQRLQGIEGFNWGAFFKWGIRVPVLNDGHAALLGEAWRGAAQGCTDILMITLGTGVGGAAMVDGRVLRGHLGRAGHVGHISLDPDGQPDICGTPGSLERAIGNCTVRERSGGRFSTTQDLIRAYRDNDTAASAVWLKSVRALAAGVVTLANVLDPAIVVIGGGIAEAGDALFTPLRDLVDGMEWKVPAGRLQIVPAVLGDKAGAYGAAYHALGYRSANSHEDKFIRSDLSGSLTRSH